MFWQLVLKNLPLFVSKRVLTLKPLMTKRVPEIIRDWDLMNRTRGTRISDIELNEDSLLMK